MALRSFWRKVAGFSCFLLMVGLFEFVMVVQLQSSLHTGENEDSHRAKWTRTTPRVRAAEHEQIQSPWHIGGWQSRTQQEERRREDEDEVRKARELHNLRKDRLNNFRKRARSDQQLLPAIPEPEQHRNNERDPKMELQKKWQSIFQYLEGSNGTLKLNDTLRLEVLKLWNMAMEEDMYRLYEKDPEEDSEKEDEDQRSLDPDDYEIIIGEDGRMHVRKKVYSQDPEILVENCTYPIRNVTLFEREGRNILLSVRTTVSNHKTRLPLLFDTWITKVNTSQLFLVTDGEDPYAQLWMKVKGVNYVNAKCGNTYTREQLCCKAGVELQLMYQPQNEAFDWICHIDDDMYVNVKNLVTLLSVFHPRKDPIYLGRSGSPWLRPRKVKKSSRLGEPGHWYHFAVGGMYCLSRAMLDQVKKWIVGGEVFSESCSLTEEPEDVTVGLIVDMLNYTLSRTELINTHGLHLASTVDPYTLRDQVAISYGFGAVKWGEDPYNAVYVPDGLFTLEEDESQFRSLHCLLYPTTSWCEQKEAIQSKEAMESQLDYEKDADYYHLYNE